MIHKPYYQLEWLAKKCRFPPSPACLLCATVPSPQVPAVAGTASVEQGFMSAAVKAANEHLWGTLSCTLLVHPATEAAHGPAVRAALDGLQVRACLLLGLLNGDATVLRLTSRLQPRV